jgi:hypothetical protein
MSILLNEKSEEFVEKIKIVNFTVTSPYEGDPYVTVVYGSYMTNNVDIIIPKNPQLVILHLSKDQLISSLPAKNPYSLPEFSELYTSLKTLLEDHFNARYSCKDGKLTRIAL